ncbi:MAG TPA: hypothetical protein VKS60_10815 [Stellaceae bacterium]|nr:hypothetical protein [Stellaceae bacterium]
MKERILLAGLGTVSLVLAVIIGLELLPGGGPMAAKPAAGPAADKDPPPSALHPAEVDRDDMVDTLLARPLFSPTRRPDRTALAVEEGVRPTVDLPRLSGILISGDSRQAIFQAEGDDKPTVLEEGGEVAGWQIEKISDRAVVISGPGGARTVKPEFDPNAKPGEPAMPPRLVTPGQPNPPTPAGAIASHPAGLTIDPRRGIQPNVQPGVPNRPGGPIPPRPMPGPNNPAPVPGGNRN